jgi:CheY-like chemotaxis protein
VALAEISGATACSEGRRITLIDHSVLDSQAGESLLQQLRRCPPEQRTNIIILAPRGWEQSHAELARDADAVVHHPVLYPVLSRVLQRLLTTPVASDPQFLLASKPDPTSSVSTATSGLLPLVLVVDDHPVNQLVARKMLLSMGCMVEIVSDGAQAVQAAAARSYDLILMDCSMPVMDGYTATEQIRLAAQYSDTVIVAMTANVLVGEREHCLACGMNDYLSKPLRKAELNRVLEQWIHQSQQRS